MTAHGSMPEQGDNALYKAARGVLKLAEHGFNLQRHHHLGGPTINVGTMHGGLNINSVPDLAKVEIDIRTISGQSNDALCEEIGDLLGKDAELSRIVDIGGVASCPENPWIESVFALVPSSRIGNRSVR